MIVGVVAALAAEARALEALNDDYLVALSGMGISAAAGAAQSLVKEGAAALMTFGLAGGLDPTLPAGCVLLPVDVLAADGTRYPTSAPWRARLAGLLGVWRPVTAGTLLTSIRSIDSVADKARALRDTGAVAVDMESSAVADVAAIHGLPFIALRVVVDTAGDTLPSAVVAASRDGQVQIGRLMAGLIKAPGELAGLIRLAARYRTAVRTLKLVARDGLAPV